MHLTVKQAAIELNVSVHTIRAWLSRRRLGYVRLGRSVRRFAAALRPPPSRTRSSVVNWGYNLRQAEVAATPGVRHERTSAISCAFRNVFFLSKYRGSLQKSVEDVWRNTNIPRRNGSKSRATAS